MAEFTVEMIGVQDTILRECADPGMKRKDIALTYAFGLRQSVMSAAATKEIDWHAVNRAILERWSMAGLKYIKELAWAYAEGKKTP